MRGRPGHNASSITTSTRRCSTRTSRSPASLKPPWTSCPAPTTRSATKRLATGANPAACPGSAARGRSGPGRRPPGAWTRAPRPDPVSAPGAAVALPLPGGLPRPGTVITLSHPHPAHLRTGGYPQPQPEGSTSAQATRHRPDAPGPTRRADYLCPWLATALRPRLKVLPTATRLTQDGARGGTWRACLQDQISAAYSDHRAASPSLVPISSGPCAGPGCLLRRAARVRASRVRQPRSLAPTRPGLQPVLAVECWNGP